MPRRISRRSSVGQRRGDRRAAQEPVARVDQFGARLLEPLHRRRAGRGLGDALGRGDVVVERLGERAAQHRPRRIELHRIAALDRRQAGALERLERKRQRERMTLGDERGKAAAKSR